MRQFILVGKNKGKGFSCMHLQADINEDGQISEAKGADPDEDTNQVQLLNKQDKPIKIVIRSAIKSDPSLSLFIVFKNRGQWYYAKAFIDKTDGKNRLTHIDEANVITLDDSILNTPLHNHKIQAPETVADGWVHLKDVETGANAEKPTKTRRCTIC